MDEELWLVVAFNAALLISTFFFLKKLRIFSSVFIPLYSAFFLYLIFEHPEYGQGFIFLAQYVIVSFIYFVIIVSWFVASRLARK